MRLTAHLQHTRIRCCYWLVICTLCIGIVSERSIAQDLDGHLASGEFAAARNIATLAPPQQRDSLLAQIASAQGTTGEPIAAAQTIRGIASGTERESAIRGAGGGGAFADFGSLMQLIETTVVPDTWEALGGPSTMAPYPQGVFVDPNGTVHECTTITNHDRLDDLKSLLNRENPARRDGIEQQSWRSPSPLRVVSLRRLKDELTQQRLFGHLPSDASLNMGGLSRIQYILIEEDDVLLAGPVGGIEKVNGWYRDKETGLNTLRSDFLFTCLASAINNRAFGCTIDPTPEGLQRAAAVAQGVQSNAIPVGKAAEKMEEALGLQRVEVFGTAGDTPIGYVMVEADRHMKQLALGEAEMPEGVKNYLDVIDDSIAQGAPNQLLLRLWFKASPRKVRADAQRTVFEIAGNPIELSGENQRALANGQRGQVTRDFRSDAFVAEFNKHWGVIRAKYPIYSALESIYRVASVSELMDRFATKDQHRTLLESLAIESSNSPWVMPTPRQVASIATHHRVRHGRKVHHVVLASGGVAVDTKQTVVPRVADYNSLKSLASVADSQPKLVQSWWWNDSVR